MTFVKREDDAPLETLEDKIAAYTNGNVINTSFTSKIFSFGFNDGVIEASRFEAILHDVDARFRAIKDSQEQSGWSYLKTDG